jgi:hypothetical protein
LKLLPRNQSRVSLKSVMNAEGRLAKPRIAHMKVTTGKPAQELPAACAHVLLAARNSGDCAKQAHPA